MLTRGHALPAVIGFCKIAADKMPVICKGAVPLLDKVTDCGALVVPTYWLPKVRLVEEIEAPGSREIFATKASPKLPPKSPERH